MEIRVPPLRERPDDIVLLSEWFLAMAADQIGGCPKSIQPDAMGLLEKYFYPGNIRELKNIIAGAYHTTKGTIIGPENLPPEVRREGTSEANPESGRAAERLYRAILQGKGDFEGLVKKPFLRHQLDDSTVRWVIQKALKDAAGKYKDAFARLRVPDKHYAAAIQFLKRHKCYLDYKPFRRKR